MGSAQSGFGHRSPYTWGVELLFRIPLFDLFMIEAAVGDAVVHE